MKSSVDMLRVLFLLLIFSVSHTLAFANTPDPQINIKSAFQDKTSVPKKKGISDQNSSRLKAPLAVNLTVDAYQSRIAILNWSDPGLPGNFVVQRFDVASGWLDIKKLPSTILSHNDTISYPYCNLVNFTYKILFESSSGSDDASSPGVDITLSDKTPPADVKNLNVDICFLNDLYSPKLSWDFNTSDSILRYEIQRYEVNGWHAIESVDADSNYFYDKSASPACAGSFKYMVLVYDMCSNPSGEKVFDDLAVQTIKLDVAFPDQCDKSVKLQWNPSIHMAGGLKGYKIFRKNGSTTVELPETQNTSCTDNSDFINGQTYFYSVKAISNDVIHSSTSCEETMVFSGVIVPDTVYITQVSVEDDSYIRLGYHLYPPDAVKKLILERSEDGGITFHAIDSLPLVLNGTVAADHFFVDSTADVHQQSYSYRLVAFDDCGFPTQSNTSRSIFLDCASSQTENILEWNKYEFWQQGVKGYDVYRVLNREASSALNIGNADPATVSYSDLLTNYDNSKEACYWVAGTENPGNFLNNPISVSNTCCIIRDPVLFMPNAFRPEGLNKLFRPVPDPLYIDSQSFKMIIYNKWGQQLFETTNIGIGWDGTINGQASPAGLYSYILTFKSAMGEEFTKRGTVMLLR